MRSLAPRLGLAALLLLAGLRTGHAQPTPVGPAHAANVTKKGKQFGPSVTADAVGRFAVVWTDKCTQNPDHPVFPCSDPSPDGDTKVAAAADGSFAVTWQSSSMGGDPNALRIRARLFSRAGVPLGSELLVDEKEFPSWVPFSSTVVALPEGGFLLAWDGDTRRTHEIFVRTLRAVGADVRLGEIVQVSQDRQNTHVELARDPRGGFLAVWTQTDAAIAGWFLAGRRLDARGRPFGRVFELESDPPWNLDHVDPAATPTGFVLAWTFGFDEGPGPDGEASSVYLQRYIVSAPGADLCAFSAGGFGCDLLRDGGADLVLGFGAPPDRPLLGDVDGDGRDEICLARDGRLRCDTNHDGGGAELDVPFDPAGGEPLLGNMDGY